MTEQEYPNLYIFMSDALRRDFFPENLKGTTVPAKGAGHHTPESFTAMLTGLTSDNHGVKKFPQSVDVPTVFELSQEGYDVSLWDHPDDVTYKMLRFPPRKPLEDLEEPFIFVHRDTATHAPYPTDWKQETMETGIDVEGRVYPDVSGPEYIEKMAEGEVDYRQDYINAVERALKYFKEDIQKLKDMGVYDNTFKVFASDHGDAWPEDERGTLAHRQPVPEVINVATNFFDHDVEVPDEFRDDEGDFGVQHILRMWRSDWDSKRRELDVKGSSEDEAEELEQKVKNRLKNLGYMSGDEEDWKNV